MNVGLVTLGCTKNQVDSEMILGLFSKNGFNITNNLDEADIIVVNTCGFIESAKKEAIDTIFDMSDYKIYGKCKYLIVTGCLAKRYKSEILKTMPEVDLCIGVDEYPKISKILSNFLNQDFSNQSLEFKGRIVSTNFPLAYVRISDGCDNRCSYCAIPLIRGSFKSRTMEDILEEVEVLCDSGAQEICLISQDTTRYGLDIYGKRVLPELIQKISKLNKVKWIRILYMYLDEITDELIEEIKNNDKVCKYFDLPVQHISNKILKSMNRRDTKEKIYEVIEDIREKIPNAIIRTTVIVGFPGETDEDFEELKKGVEDIKFDRMGAFTFSKEENTKAYDMDDQVLQSVKKKRYDELLNIQKNISLNSNKKLLGNVYEVVVEDVSLDNKYFMCRSYMNAPDVDGKIYIKLTDENIKKIAIGEFYKVKIINCSEYDLFARLI